MGLLILLLFFIYAVIGMQVWSTYTISCWNPHPCWWTWSNFALLDQAAFEKGSYLRWSRILKIDWNDLCGWKLPFLDLNQWPLNKTLNHSTDWGKQYNWPTQALPSTIAINHSLTSQGVGESSLICINSLLILRWRSVFSTNMLYKSKLTVEKLTMQMQPFLTSLVLLY